jgi:hypothetical protein
MGTDTAPASKPMQDKRVAVVVSHPAHLLTVAGMLLRWRPHVLLLNRAVAGRGVGQDRLMRGILRRLGLGERTTSLGVSETESYRRALAGDFGFHLDVGRLVRDWLLRTGPDVVFADAYEASNYQHDVARLLLDRAVGECRAFGVAMVNYEFPLFCRPTGADSALVYGTFPAGPRQTLRLTPAELAIKLRLADSAAKADPFIGEVVPLFATPDREPYRCVPPDRDYTRPPDGLALYYDERGRADVAAGRHARLITFGEHFVPLARAVRAERCRGAAA